MSAVSVLSPHEVEVPVDTLINALSSIADVLRDDDEINSLRRGFIDGLNENNSIAKPGDVPEFYGTGYRLGGEILELVRWTKQIEVEAVRRH